MWTFTCSYDKFKKIPRHVKRLVIMDESLLASVMRKLFFRKMPFELPRYLCHRLEKLQEVILPHGVRVIGQSSFEGCLRLTSIVLPRTVETICDKAFDHCTALTQVDLPKGLKFLGKQSFFHCVSLIQISIPSGVEVVGESCFASCRSLEHVDFSMGIREIGRGAFSYCYSLKAVSLPSTVTTIRNDAFRGCASLIEVNVSIEGLIHIGDSAFERCLSMPAFFLPGSLQHVGNKVFDYCTRLVTIEIPENLSAATGNASFVAGCRFDESWPAVYKVCCHASTSTVDELRAALDSTHCTSNEPIRGPSRQDQIADWDKSFGLNPFHVVMAAARPRQDLLQVLLDYYPSNALHSRDRFGKRAMNYLVFNRTEKWRYMAEMSMDRLTQNWGIDSWKREINCHLMAVLSESHYEEKARLYKEMWRVVERYEMIDAASLLELALWKKEIKSGRKGAKRVALDRNMCRAVCGCSFVVPNVLEFVG